MILKRKVIYDDGTFLTFWSQKRKRKSPLRTGKQSNNIVSRSKKRKNIRTERKHR
jgi:hypothetical protein